MTTQGRVDCYINPSDPSLGRRQNEIYVNLIQFLTGASALGISLIAANTGAVGLGNGFDFWDTANSVGALRAWSVWRFSNAPRGKFDMLLFLTTGSGGPSFGGVTINQGTSINAFNGFGAIGWACAVHPSGSVSNPWNGSATIGSSSMANPVWVTASGGGLAVFPRANSFDGSYPKRDQLTMLHDDALTLPTRMHVLATEGSFTVLQDPGLTNSTRIFHFGSYAPRPGFTSDAPYFMFTGQGTPSTNDIIKYWTAANVTYGSTAGISANTNDGGIAPPTLTSGSKTLTFITIGIPDASYGSFNIYVNSGSYDQLPLFVAVSDAGITGIIGQADYIGVTFGISNGSVNAASGTAVFGKTTAATAKVIVPWSGSSPGFLNNIRTGRTF